MRLKPVLICCGEKMKDKDTSTPSFRSPKIRPYLKILFKNIENFGKYDIKELALREAWHKNIAYEVADKIEKQAIRLPRVRNRFETLTTVVETQRSITRFGDGEFNLAMGRSIPFQTASPILSERLKEILRSDDERVHVCIADVFGSLDQYIDTTQTFWRKFHAQYRDEIYALLDMDKQYLDTHISRPYIDYRDRSHTAAHYEGLKKLWDGLDVVIVEGEQTQMGSGNDLLGNARSIKRIMVPSRNAFDQYSHILDTVSKETKEALYLLCIGPTATVLAYDMARLGYYALDIGHLDAEYEWFLSGTEKRVNIAGKFSLGYQG
jgi:glycosyltransferase family protein